MTQDVTLKFAEGQEIEACLGFDPEVSFEQMKSKIENHEILIAVKETQVIAYLKLQYLWESKPFISLIKVAPPYRGQGIGRNLLAYLTYFLEMNGFNALYSSSQVNECSPQEWHRKMGFVEAGIINGINDGGHGELFFKLYIGN